MSGRKRGNCKLCHLERDLCVSHYLSKGLYKALHPKNQNPLLVTGKVAFRTSRQMTAVLLCSDCEKLLNDMGERYTIRVMSNQKGFLLLKTIQGMTPVVADCGSAAYKCAGSPKIDTGALAHFALGLLWKASVHRWSPAPGVLTGGVDLGPYQEAVRKYLMGQSGFPKNVVVKITLCTDAESQHWMYEPTLGKSKGSKEFNYYEMLAGGINFGIHIGKGIPGAIRGHCCVSSRDQWIFVRDCRERTLSAVRGRTGGKTD